MDTKKTFLENIDPDIIERVSSRRDALRKASKLGVGLALASAPVAFGALSRKAFGQALPANVTEVLNFALTLEYLEAAYYSMGLSSGVIPGEAEEVYQQISAHEDAHVSLLEGVLGDDAVDEPSFDFTAGDTFDPFNNYGQFLALSQGFEDTGVRAYKGQAGELMGNDMILTTALQIHSVEGRHAAMVRRLRGFHGGNDEPDAWITLASTNVAALQAVYDGEANVTQLGIDTSGLEADAGNINEETASEAFDEPLSMSEVNAIAGMFIEG